MRIWSLHPKYLDAKGLVAVWRETLLAKHVLLGKTRGYQHHPQLQRFKKLKDPVAAIDQYLDCILTEANSRNYKFDPDKISTGFRKIKMNLTEGQLAYETSHLLKKLKSRDLERFTRFKTIKVFETHPMFRIVKGEVEDWEIIR